jgi:hypothetical protein
LDPITIASLITAACNALVTAAVTDSWEKVRLRVASWFGRGVPDSKTLERLAATRAEIVSVTPSERDQVQQALAQQWAGRFKDLIADHPLAAEELDDLVNELAMVTASASGYSVAAGGNVTIKADHGGLAAGVIHGAVAAPGPTVPGLRAS